VQKGEHAASWLVVVALMSAAIFGNVSSIMLRLYRGTQEYHEKLTSTREFIKFHFIPKPLANRLIESCQHSRSFTQGVDMNSVSQRRDATRRSVIYRPVVSDCRPLDSRPAL